MWLRRNREPDVAVYRTATTCQAEIVSNVLQTAGLPYHRQAETFLGYGSSSVRLPGEGEAELFFVPAEKVEAAKGALASLPFPPPDGQPVVEPPVPPRTDGLHRALAPGWVIAAIVLELLVLMAWAVVAGRTH